MKDEKRCPRCGDTKPAAEFGVRGSRPFLRSRCRPCENAIRREAYPARREQEAASFRRWFQKARYGFSPGDYDALLAKQGGGCAICGSTTPGASHRKHLYIDHDHVTNRVRGLLCGNCNSGLGMFADDPDRMREAIAYLSEATSNA